MSYNITTLTMSRSTLINYTYIITDRETNHAAIVDPSWEFDTVQLALQNKNINNITILLTHSHIDHTYIVKELTESFQTHVYIHEKESRYYNYNCNNLHLFTHNEEIHFGSTKTKALFTPGHTAGSSCFLFENDIFTGDTLFIEGCGTCKCPGGSAEQLFNSIQMLKNTVSKTTSIYPGHAFTVEPGISFAQLYKTNIYLHIYKQSTFIKMVMRDKPNKLNPGLP